MTTIDDLWGKPSTTTDPPTPDPVPEQSPAAPPKARPEWAMDPEPDKRGPNPIAKWIGDMQGDIAARKSRSDGRWWAMRWMNEQPTSVNDLITYFVRERDRRLDGREGWGLTTLAPVINGTHAALYRAYGFTVAIPAAMVTAALGWMLQRPGRGVVFLAATVFVLINLSTWLGGPQ